MTKKVGLALGSGAARGFAHIGVIQVFLENNIPIDVVTGCSMGALIGGLYVSGVDMYYLQRYAEKFDMRQYYDISMRNGGLIKGRRIEELLRLLTKNTTIEQGIVPYGCTAVDVCTGEIVEFTKGVMYQAIRASISIPVSYTHLVELLPRQDAALRPYEKNIQKYIPMPAMAKKLHVENEKRMNALEEAANTLKINRVEMNSKKIGVIAAGICYQYAKEALPEASFLKPGHYS